MNQLINWILNPGGMSDLRKPGGGGDGGAGAREQEAESAREQLRQRINAMYGVAPPQLVAPTHVPEGGVFNNAKWFNLLSGQPQQDPALPSVATGALSQLEAEKKRIADATSGYYTDELGKGYEKATRANKFGLARRSLLGGSVEADTGAALKGDLELGATRVSDAARRAAAGLDTAREQERLQAIGLANAGAGESAISAASTGLRNAFANAESAQKADLFGGLFSAGAGQVEANADAVRQAKLAAMMRAPRLGVTPSRTATETPSY